MRVRIDNIETEAEGTILNAARKLGIEIPTLCYDDRLSPYGGCRLCLVEVDGELKPACTTPLCDGMEILTDTDRIRRTRRQIIELLLSDHIDDCLLCEEGGACKLQHYAYLYSAEKERFRIEPIKRKPILESRFIKRDENKCILCARCVRICEEVMGKGVLSFANRGYSLQIVSGLNKPLQETDCEFCGQCISVCPTGALSPKKREKVRVWDVQRKGVVCPYCGCGCKMDLEVFENKVVGVRADIGTHNRGNLCIKGRFGMGFINHPERLKTPLIRKNGAFRRASWDEAVEYVAEKLTEIREKYGADAIGGLSSAKCTNEENFLFQKFMRAVVGTNNVDHCARLCHSPTVSALASVWGSGAMTNTIEDIQDADVILITGSNTTEAHPIVAISVKKALNRGAKLIVADPRRIELSDCAEIFLQQRPGTDVALFSAIAHIILKEGVEDRDFIEKRTEGFGQFVDSIKDCTPEWAERITGVSAERIKEAARLYAKAERAVILYSMGITQHTTGVENVLCLANLVMLTANVGRRGVGLNPLRGQVNVQGACDMGALPILYSGYQKVADFREKFEKAWGVKLSDKPGLTVTEMIESEDIKALYIMGENPMVSDPDINKVREELEAKEFVVVQDIFLTETAKLADVVLPAACFAEKSGTYTSTERRIQLSEKAIDPPGDAKCDWEIICELSKKMGYTISYQSPADVMAEIAELTPIYGGVSYDRLKREEIFWPCPEKSHPGTPILHKDQFTRGKGVFSVVEYKPPAEEPDREYPFVLTTGRCREHYHTGTMTRKTEIGEAFAEGFFEINPRDAEKLRIADGEMARLTSKRGSIMMRAKVTERSPKGVIFIPFHFAESAANCLTNKALDPVAKIPELKVCAVRIEPC